jgi:PPM family protein phosphatase
VVTHETLGQALQDPDPQACADRLIELALRSGGPDNITCIVADVVEDDGRSTLIDPVVDGAAGDNRGQREVDPRSAAGRAALADPTPAPPASAVSSAAPARRRRPLRTGLIALATVLTLGLVAFGGYLFVMRHWFVGVHDTTDGQEVAVFQGLDASVVGVDLYRLDSATGLASSDLTQAARSRVRAGIDAGDRADAQRILANLRDQQLPVCRTTAPAATTAEAGPTPDGTVDPAAPTDPAAVPTDPAAPTDTAAPAATSPSDSPSATGSPSRTGEPGVDCREDD